jgi:hypothetical protein
MDTADESAKSAASNAAAAAASGNKENTEDVKDFVKIGRTGRRNAVADVISDPNLNISTVNITELMMKINCGGADDEKSKDES